ncbi:MAG: type II secretion system protein [Phycisphaerales bacterium]|jgi:prepilin-type N-terminal cleavage/methylation domain-containing protein|nr:type II secretion system protein [Phycisphaerales bacterium]
MPEVNTSRTAAFTLVELLVVIVILALLTTILAPSIQRVMADANVTKCKNNLMAQTKGHMLYASEHRFNKPPLRWKSGSSIRYTATSPNTKMSNQPIGQGILVAGNYISLRTILCPDSALVDDANLDEESWLNRSISGSSYSYFWRHTSTYKPRAEMESDFKYADSERSGRYGLAMDINAKAGGVYIGAYGGGDLISHEVSGVVNISYSDGTVVSEDNSKIILGPSGSTSAKMDWWDLAHQAHPVHDPIK